MRGALAVKSLMRRKQTVRYSKKKIAISSKYFDQSMIETLKTYFDEIDDDASGTLDHSELKQLVTNLGVQATEEQVQEMLKLADTDGNGMVDFVEFVRALEGDENSVMTIQDTCDQVFPHIASETGGQEQIDARGMLAAIQKFKIQDPEITLQDCEDIIAAINDSCPTEGDENKYITKQQFYDAMQLDLDTGVLIGDNA